MAGSSVFLKLTGDSDSGLCGAHKDSRSPASPTRNTDVSDDSDRDALRLDSGRCGRPVARAADSEKPPRPGDSDSEQPLQ